VEEIPDLEDRELVLRLSQEVVAVHREEPIDFGEWNAYQELLRGLNLPITAIDEGP
jgi:urea transport system ATP-binding protein